MFNQNYSHKLRRFFQKFSIKMIRSLNQSSEPKRGEYEHECLSICKNLIHKESTTLLISPISGKRYIKNDDSQIFIIIENRLLTIVNHSYSYNIEIPNKSFDRLSSIFDNEVEIRRHGMETEIRSNVKHSLSNIYKNILNEEI